jgi:hypothetical protein
VESVITGQPGLKAVRVETAGSKAYTGASGTAREVMAALESVQFKKFLEPSRAVSRSF